MTIHNADHQPDLCTQAQELLPVYSMGLADENERAIVEAGLSACPELADELASYEDLTEAMLYATPQLAAPPEIGARLMQSIAATATPVAPQPASSKPSAPQPALTPDFRPPESRTRSTWQRMAMPLGALAASIALFLATNLYWARENMSLREQLNALTPTGKVLNSADAHDVSRVSFSPEENQPGGTLEWSRGAAENTWIAWLSIEKMPTLSEGIYQLWLMREGENPVSAGLFNAAEDGRALLIFVVTEPVGAYDFIGITVEPEGGSAEPTTNPVMEGSLQNNA